MPRFYMRVACVSERAQWVDLREAEAGGPPSELSKCSKEPRVA